MYVRIVSIRVKQEHLDEFIEATRLNHEGSVKEPGNRRFDVLQQADDPTRFVLYEAYDSEQSSAAHKRTSHYAVWRSAVQPWLDGPREGAAYDGLFPQAASS